MYCLSPFIQGTFEEGIHVFCFNLCKKSFYFIVWPCWHWRLIWRCRGSLPSFIIYLLRRDRCLQWQLSKARFRVVIPSKILHSKRLMSKCQRPSLKRFFSLPDLQMPKPLRPKPLKTTTTNGHCSSTDCAGLYLSGTHFALPVLSRELC